MLSCYALLLSLRNLLISNERQKRSGSGWERRWGGTGSSRGGGECIQTVMYEKKGLCLIKRGEGGDYWIVLVDLNCVLVLNPDLHLSLHSILAPPWSEVFQLSLVSCCLLSQSLQFTETPHLDDVCSCRSATCLSAEGGVGNESILRFCLFFIANSLKWACHKVHSSPVEGTRLCPGFAEPFGTVWLPACVWCIQQASRVHRTKLTPVTNLRCFYSFKSELVPDIHWNLLKSK